MLEQYTQEVEVIEQVVVKKIIHYCPLCGDRIDNGFLFDNTEHFRQTNGEIAPCAYNNHVTNVHYTDGGVSYIYKIEGLYFVLDIDYDYERQGLVPTLSVRSEGSILKMLENKLNDALDNVDHFEKVIDKINNG